MRPLFSFLCVLLLFTATGFAKRPASPPEELVEAGQQCGGLSRIGCAGDLYCEYEVGVCGREAEFGVCRPRAELCAMVYRPVCGCDGETYSNACSAAAAGVSVEHEGECGGG